MLRILFIAVMLAFASEGLCQGASRDLFEAERSFLNAIEAKGMRQAFLETLSLDSVIFRPDPTNGREFWTDAPSGSSATLKRFPHFGDTSQNGLMGYTTGSWKSFPNGPTKSAAKFGQYVTIWEQRRGRFFATVDIEIGHDEIEIDTGRPDAASGDRDPNKRGWSPADASMDFLRISMSGQRLGAAFSKYAAADVRLLMDRQLPIVGKSKVVEATGDFLSVEFPEKVALLQSADMAYSWHTCSFADSGEGTEKGNCLYVWKLREKKWWIVLGVFARKADQRPPAFVKGTKHDD